MKNLSMLFSVLLLLISCGGNSANNGESESIPGQVQNDPKKNKGIGPVKEVVLGDIDQAKVALGKKDFNVYCTACHKIDEDYIGPTPKGILDRRSPEWVMNMILNPEEMVQKDVDAKKLYEQFNMAPMANMGLSQEQARNVLEYFRTL